jgi:hypothetical protein
MKDDMKFVVISDIHYGSHNNIKQTTNRLKTFTRWLKLHEDELDSVIVLGDTVFNTSKQPIYNEEMFKTVYELFNTADVTISFLAGDQDVNALSQRIMENYIGSIHGVRDKFIGLDTSWEEQSGPQGKIDQKIFELYDFPQDGYIFSHHPLVPWDLEDNHWFAGNPEQAYSIDKESVWKNCIKKLNPRLVINGHIREQKSGVFDGIPCYSVKPFNKETRTSTKPSGYFYTVEDDGSTIQIIEHIAQEDNVVHNINTEKFDIETTE